LTKTRHKHLKLADSSWNTLYTVTVKSKHTSRSKHEYLSVYRTI